MICVDTNVLVRCITQDDKAQAPKALAFLKRALASREGVYIPDVIVVECAWVLQKNYRFSPQAIAAALEPLLLEPKVATDHRDRVLSALSLFSTQGISITDAYLASAASRPGSSLATFDQKLKAMSSSHFEP